MPPRSVRSALLLITAVIPSLPMAQRFGVVGAVMTFVVGGCVALAAQWRMGWWGRRYRVTCAVWDSEGQWWLTLPDRGSVRACLCSQSVVLPRGSWLKFRTEVGTRAVQVLAGDFSAALYRRLLVRLRLLGAHQDAVEELSSDGHHIRRPWRTLLQNFPRSSRSIRALMELPWPRVIERDETRGL